MASYQFRRHVLIVGLGNYTHPGTRHNVGMMVVDSLAQRFNAEWSSKNTWQSEVATATTTLTLKASPKFLLNHASKSQPASPKSTTDVPTTSEDGAPNSNPAAIKKSKITYSVELTLTFLKPRLLMNVCGSSISRAVRDLGLKSSDILVIHDDMERDIGKISFKGHGSANGHNGVKSCIKALNSQYFQRLRIGIGRPPVADRSPETVARFVLGKFKPLEVQALEDLVFDKAGDEIIRVTSIPV